MHQPTHTKAQWRAELALRRREHRDDPTRAGEAAALAHLAAPLLPVPGGTVALYEPWPDEPDAAGIAALARAAGVHVLVPGYRPGGALEPCWVKTGAAPRADEAGGEGAAALPAAALAAAALTQAQVIFLPAQAADLSGTRLGRGAAWYDRALGHAAAGAVRVAVVFEWEVLEAGALPREAHDQPVGAILTPQRLIRLSAPPAQ